MNNYIIDPSVFYWVNVLSIIQTVCGVLAGFILTGSLICAGGCIYNQAMIISMDDEDNKTFLKVFRKWLIVTLLIGTIFLLIAIFVPGKSTSIEMMVAKTATFENVGWTVAQVKEIIDYIVSALNGV